jgi:hypothetical protein
MLVEISQDFEVLRETALTLMTHSAWAAAAGEAAADVPPADVDPTYASWVEHLMAVERARDLLTMPLRADVAHGLQALSMARAEFGRRHKGCPNCGIWISRGAKICPCGWRET